MLAVLGLANLAFSAVSWHLYEPGQFLSYLVMAVVCSVVQVKQSSARVAFSLNVPFILLSMVELTPPEAVLVGCSAVLAQSILDPQVRRSLLRIFLSVTVAATSIASADFVTSVLVPRSLQSVTARLFVAAGVFFVANTLPSAIALRFTRRERLGEGWRKSHFWSFPYYLVSASITAVALGMRSGISLDSALLARFRRCSWRSATTALKRPSSRKRKSTPVKWRRCTSAPSRGWRARWKRRICSIPRATSAGSNCTAWRSARISGMGGDELEALAGSRLAA